MQETGRASENLLSAQLSDRQQRVPYETFFQRSDPKVCQGKEKRLVRGQERKIECRSLQDFGDVGFYLSQRLIISGEVFVKSQ